MPCFHCNCRRAVAEPVLEKKLRGGCGLGPHFDKTCSILDPFRVDDPTASKSDEKRNLRNARLVPRDTCSSRMGRESPKAVYRFCRPSYIVKPEYREGGLERDAKYVRRLAAVAGVKRIAYHVECSHGRWGKWHPFTICGYFSLRKKQRLAALQRRLEGGGPDDNVLPAVLEPYDNGGVKARARFVFDADPQDRIDGPYELEYSE